jgi:hypothetical protein
LAAIATEPSKLATVRAERLFFAEPVAQPRDTSTGITLASVVISGAMRRPSAALRSA